MSDEFAGPVRRWVKDGILYAENDFCLLCWGPTDDLAQVGKLGWYGPDQICVEFVSKDTFDKACSQPGVTYE